MPVVPFLVRFLFAFFEFLGYRRSTPPLPLQHTERKSNSNSQIDCSHVCFLSSSQTLSFFLSIASLIGLLSISICSLDLFEINKFSIHFVFKIQFNYLLKIYDEQARCGPMYDCMHPIIAIINCRIQMEHTCLHVTIQFRLVIVHIFYAIRKLDGTDEIQWPHNECAMDHVHCHRQNTHICVVQVDLMWTTNIKWCRDVVVVAIVVKRVCLCSVPMNHFS